jgi:hypothetical protein
MHVRLCSEGLESIIEEGGDVVDFAGSGSTRRHFSLASEYPPSIAFTVVGGG